MNKKSPQKFSRLTWTIAGIFLMVVLVSATTTITDTGIDTPLMRGDILNISGILTAGDISLSSQEHKFFGLLTLENPAQGNTIFRIISNASSADLRIDRGSFGTNGDIRYFTRGNLTWIAGQGRAGQLDNNGSEYFIGQNETDDHLVLTAHGNTGLGTASPNNLLTVDGSGMLQLEMNTSARTCNETNAGGIYYDNATHNFFGCNVTAWVQLNN